MLHTHTAALVKAVVQTVVLSGRQQQQDVAAVAGAVWATGHATACKETEHPL
jgi:hypothetical protein